MTDIRSTPSATIALPTPKIDENESLQIIFEQLAQEGFRPKFDEDGSIGFKCEGWRLYLDAYQAGGGFRLYSCVFWELDLADRTKALSVANEVNSERRCVKAFVNSNNTVWVSYETHCADAAQYSRTVITGAEFIASACREYREIFRRESQPVTLN
jgi:hypothetical protein